VGNVIISLLFLAILTPSSAVQRIERAFLQNRASLLLELLPREGRINLSFPEPILFSDQISDQQTYFFLNNVFKTFTTLEFYPDRQTPPKNGSRYIFKARWSFQDKTNNLYPLNVFFHLVLTEATPGSERRWIITDIRAETI
jgi:hypothetical protein